MLLNSIVNTTIKSTVSAMSESTSVVQDIVGHNNQSARIIQLNSTNTSTTSTSTTTTQDPIISKYEQCNYDLLFSHLPQVVHYVTNNVNVQSALASVQFLAPYLPDSISSSFTTTTASPSTTQISNYSYTTRPPSVSLLDSAQIKYQQQLTYKCCFAILSLLFGLFYSLIGYRCLKTATFIIGFVLGSGTIYLILSEQRQLTSAETCIIAVSIGFLFSFIAYLVQYIGLFLLGVTSSVTLATLILVLIDLFYTNKSAWLCIGLLFLCATLVASLTLKFQKTFGILNTAAIGSMLLLVSLDFFAENNLLLDYVLELYRVNGNSFNMFERQRALLKTDQDFKFLNSITTTTTTTTRRLYYKKKLMGGGGDGISNHGLTPKFNATLLTGYGSAGNATNSGSATHTALGLILHLYSSAHARLCWYTWLIFGSFFVFLIVSLLVQFLITGKNYDHRESSWHRLIRGNRKKKSANLEKIRLKSNMSSEGHHHHHHHRHHHRRHSHHTIDSQASSGSETGGGGGSASRGDNSALHNDTLLLVESGGGTIQDHGVKRGRKESKHHHNGRHQHRSSASRAVSGNVKKTVKKSSRSSSSKVKNLSDNEETNLDMISCDIVNEKKQSRKERSISHQAGKNSRKAESSKTRKSTSTKSTSIESSNTSTTSSTSSSSSHSSSCQLLPVKSSSAGQSSPPKDSMLCGDLSVCKPLLQPSAPPAPGSSSSSSSNTLQTNTNTPPPVPSLPPPKLPQSIIAMNNSQTTNSSSSSSHQAVVNSQSSQLQINLAKLKQHHRSKEKEKTNSINSNSSHNDPNNSNDKRFRYFYQIRRNNGDVLSQDFMNNVNKKRISSSNNIDNMTVGSSHSTQHTSSSLSNNGKEKKVTKK